LGAKELCPNSPNLPENFLCDKRFKKNTKSKSNEDCRPKKTYGAKKVCEKKTQILTYFTQSYLKVSKRLQPIFLGFCPHFQGYFRDFDKSKLEQDRSLIPPTKSIQASACRQLSSSIHLSYRMQSNKMYKIS